MASRPTTPSTGSFNRVFAALDPEQFRAGFASWTTAVAGVLPTQVIALDGKTVRGSHARTQGKAAIHIVSAWASTNRPVLAQTKVDEKSNEITAIPALLGQLALTGCIVTLDAMGCQRAIAHRPADLRPGGRLRAGAQGESARRARRGR